MSSPESYNPLDALEWLRARRRDVPRELPPEQDHVPEWPAPILAEGVEHVWQEPLYDVDGVLSGFEERRAGLRDSDTES